MSIYKSYKHGATVKTLAKTHGVRKTYYALKRKLPSTNIRIKHNKIQMLGSNGNWKYTS